MSTTNNLYIGATSDLKKRLKQHKDGKTASLKEKGIFQLIYYEAFLTSEEAFQKEKFYKSGRGHEVLYSILFKSLTRV